MIYRDTYAKKEKEKIIYIISDIIVSKLLSKIIVLPELIDKLVYGK